MGDVFHTYDFCGNDDYQSIGKSFDIIGGVVSIFIGLIVFSVICLITGDIMRHIRTAMPKEGELVTYKKYNLKKARCRLHRRKLRLKHG